MRAARRHGRPFVARGSGTGLAGGAVPLDDAVVIVTTQMNRILEVDAASTAVAWVEPGVLNLDLTRALRGPRAALRPRPVEPAGVHHRRQRGQQLRRAPLPGLRRHRAHVLALEVVLAGRRRSPCSAARTPSRAGYDLRGAFVGSEGTMGIATAVAVRLTPDPPAVRTLLLDFDDRGRRGRDA